MASALMRYCHCAGKMVFAESTRSIFQIWYKNSILQRRVCSIHKTKYMNFHSSLSSFKKRKAAEEKNNLPVTEVSPKSKLAPTVDIWRNMTVQELATVLDKDTDHVFEVMMYVDNSIDYTKPGSVIDNWQVIKDVVKKSGRRFRIVSVPVTKKPEIKNKDVYRRPPPDPSVLVKRPPVVTIMGHVDHGKTTLLDFLRNTSVVDTEFGGITQHIGAFSVKLDNESITFLDTPGHAAFKAMRARGVQVTDIVVLVVAADDGVMEQTVESIRMAKEANVPIIVAINKIDKKEADIERTKMMLVERGVQVEDLGGDVQAVPLSALRGTNIMLLVEMIILQAQLMNLRADPGGLVEGVVIESHIDPWRGKLGTVIVQRGTLKKGSVLVAGTAWAKVRALFDNQGQPVVSAAPSTPVEVTGWRLLPSAGDEVLEVESEKHAQDVVKYRETVKKEEKQEIDKIAIEAKAQEHLKNYKVYLEKKRSLKRFTLKPTGPRQKEIQDVSEGPKLNIVLKGDVDGTVEAILNVFESYDLDDKCKVSLVHYGVGNITETDAELAEMFDAIIYGFNVQVEKTFQKTAQERKVPIRFYNVIYKLIDDVKQEINARLPSKEVESVLGEANVLQEFEINEGRKKVIVAGCRCTKGILKKTALFKLIRREDVIFEGSLKSLRHLKNDVDSIKKGVECGLQVTDPDVKFQPGDTLICYEMKPEVQKINWDPGF